MNKTDHIKSLLPAYENGDITLDEIHEKVGCTRSFLNQIIPITFRKNLIQSVNRKNFKKIQFIDAAKQIVQKHSKTVADWDSMTEKEKEPYLKTELPWTERN